MTKIKEIQNRIAEMRHQLTTEAKAAFSDMAKDVFAKYPKLVSFSWAQYTPYFNDGEECIFNAHTDSLKIAWEGAEEPMEDVGSWSLKYHKEKGGEGLWGDADFHTCVGSILEVLKEIDNETLKSMFEDHVEVTATREKVIVEEYSHD